MVVCENDRDFVSTDDCIQVAGDMLFYANFDMAQVLDYFHLKVQ